MNGEYLRSLADRVAAGLRDDEIRSNPLGFRAIMSAVLNEANVHPNVRRDVWRDIASILGSRRKRKKSPRQPATVWFVDTGEAIDYVPIVADRDLVLIEIANPVSQVGIHYRRYEDRVEIMEDAPLEIPRHVLDQAARVARQHFAFV